MGKGGGGTGFLVVGDRGMWGRGGGTGFLVVGELIFCLAMIFSDGRMEGYDILNERKNHLLCLS